MRKIVVGYDGSESAGRALGRAAELAENGTEIIVVSAVRPLGGGKGGFGFDPVEEDAHAKDLQEAAQRLAELGHKAEIVEGHGDPARVIAAQAKETGADLIIVGTEHKGLLERLVLGSVSEGVVHRADVEVLVVP
jgi:nucleotide-binding universal stress UspA family protein